MKIHVWRFWTSSPVEASITLTPLVPDHTMGQCKAVMQPAYIIDTGTYDHPVLVLSQPC